MKGSIVVVDFGMGNIHSMVKALRLYHDDVRFTGDIAEIRKASALVLPGDGAFAAAMENLNSGPLEAILEHIAQEKPLLGVCIGFQVLFENSDEVERGSADRLISGLGLVPGNIRRFRSEGGLRIPHMGWNVLIPGSDDITEDFYRSYMYFIHSYRAENVPEEYVLAYCEYGSDRFPSVIKKGNILATQFHPEKSDVDGLRFIESWVRNL